MELRRDIESPRLLTCWKDIAGYMGKGVRTVQRWEQKFGLPVRRPVGTTGKSAVMASPHDLDAWLNEHWSNRTSGEIGNSASCAEPTPPVDLKTCIRTAHELREANHVLMGEISSVLHALVHSCDQLM